MRLAELEGKRVAVWGYGREGRAALSVLTRKFTRQSFTLFCSEEEARRVEADLKLHAGESNAAAQAELRVVTVPPDAAALLAFDVVIKSPGISPYREPYLSAEKAGVRFTSGTALWFAEHVDAKTICVTGTKGKSTVTALIAHLLRKSGRRVALAGNIGLPLLELLEPAREPDWWVIERSSFQTRDFGGEPTIAVINNLLEEHLDWHGDVARYHIDKLKIVGNRSRTAVVLNAADRVAGSITTQRKTIWFNSNDGWHANGDAIWRAEESILPLARIPLPGLHNARNVCAALAAIEAAGEDARTLASHVASFKALPHRLQALGARNGIDYVNDSISTTPFAAIEALRSMREGQPVTILVGGFDRGVDWSPFVEFVTAQPPHAIVTMGANGDAIAAKLRSIAKRDFALVSERTLAEAFARAQALTPAGGAILLSPGAPSFDQFKDYAERGREFARLAGFDPAAIAQIEGMGIA